MNITVQVSKESLWGNVDPQEKGWNKKESLVNFQEIVETVLEEELPNTEITVELVDGFATHFWNDIPANNRQTSLLDYLINKAWSAFDWMAAA